MTEPGKHPLVVATVLNHNGWRDATECVESLLRSSYPNIKVVIVDNGSTDDSLERLFPLVNGDRIELVSTGRNLGSVGGTNVAIRHALKSRPEFVLTLSNDLVISPDLVETLVCTMLAEPQIGVMSTKIMYYDEPEQIWSCGMTMNHWLARGSELAATVRASQPDTRVLSVDLLIGCVMFFRRTLFDQVGLLDERYFYQNEEYDFFDRVRKAGWLVKVAMGPYVLHKIGRTIGTGSYDRWYYGTRNRLLYIRENLPLLQRIMARSFFYGTRAVKFVEWFVKGRADLVKATLEGWWDYRRHCFGKRLAGHAAS